MTDDENLPPPATELEMARFKKFGVRKTTYEDGFRIVTYHLDGRMLVDNVRKFKKPKSVEQ